MESLQGKEIQGGAEIQGWDQGVAFSDSGCHGCCQSVEAVCLFRVCVCFPPHQAGTLGCPIPKELGQFSGWKLCMGLPEDASPFSFRSILGHNTNIWAAKTTNFIPLIPFKVRAVRVALSYSNMPE